MLIDFPFLHIYFSWIEIPVRKQSRAWTDATFSGIWSGFALFVYAPQNGPYAYID